MPLVANPVSSQAILSNTSSQYEANKVLTIGHLSETLKRSGEQEIPDYLKLCDEELSTSASGVHEVSEPLGDNLQVPVIDFSLLQTDRRTLVQMLGHAARSWGCCQILNHGFSVGSMQQLIAESYKYFELPVERKQQSRSFIGDNTTYRGSSLYWAESWAIFATGCQKDLDAKVLSVWPEGNDSFRNMAAQLFKNWEDLTKQLFELYAEDLGVESDFYSKHVDSTELMVRWNYYPACPNPSTILGAKSHTDYNMFTLLLQDQVGGLQVEREGRWFDLKPIEGSLIVNIADGFHVWTNGIYKPVVHRVLVNTSKPRLSLAGLWIADDRLDYTAPDELVDANHPRLYKPMKAGDYRQKLAKTRYVVDLSKGQAEHSRLLRGTDLRDWRITPE
ncbi:hypothetical protein R1sor_016648 [Riccia sorocarpa]|uniref:Fe2OG dioxygenase domain-containing protein n=1 Tax=Riccia sorocarpa TaxID=122646 RepID=A0ABD3HJN4_9MARC